MTTSTKTKSKSKKQSSSAGIWIVVGGILLLALVAFLLWQNNRPTVVTVSQPDVPAEWINGRSLGDPAAPVVVQMWEDFVCPACQQFARTIKPQLVNDFVKPGTVRLEFRQFPLGQHAPGALMAANASECAADQNMFWPFHDRIFQVAEARGQAALTFDQLMIHAGDVGLDVEQFRTCMNTQQFSADITQSLVETQQLGLNSTPSILVNGVLAPEPFNYNALSAQIEAAASGN